MQANQRILEGLMTTTSADGSANISPMGPIVDDSMGTLRLRPYRTSTTYANLKRRGTGVFHVTDDVLLLARAAVGAVDPPPELLPCPAVDEPMLAGACRWYAVRVRSLDDSQERTEIVVDVVDRGRLRDFFGLNRAKHAVVEAAILATRVEFLPHEEILADYERLRVMVEKTGAADEHAAFEFLLNYVQTATAGSQQQHV
ncbi:MAG: DUF447 family protein [Planctomycetota bacterium]|nr:MAG: DUF447 family protein [Planctomycetota bacterium]REJ93977.1 MAG: DUF447 family protein [Planctomycetota bacterium]REK30957.1 MAG: DUF447 family protein [Planctomycetota bacterium]REK38209.1 MAG: DUF447 family protein [Planctomycetota bacterium]